MNDSLSPNDIIRTVIWQRIDPPGAEHARLRQTTSGEWVLEGTVVAALDGIPARVRYSVRADVDWMTRRVVIEQIHGRALARVILSHDARGWRCLTGDVALPDTAANCADIALMVTPATYSLPIRRLMLDVGATHDVPVLKLRFPAFQAEVESCRWTRLDENRYQCENLGSGKITLIEVDDLGLLLREPDRWERVAAES